MRRRWSLEQKITKKGVENEEPGLQSKLPDRLEQHGDEVDKVASCQNRQKLEGGHIILDMCFYNLYNLNNNFTFITLENYGSTFGPWGSVLKWF